MNLRGQLRQLEALASRAGLGVRYDRMATRGGLVRLGKDRLILCQESLPIIDKIGVIAEALATIGVDVINIPPVMRARIHGTRASLGGVPRPRLVLKPIAKVRKTG